MRIDEISKCGTATRRLLGGRLPNRALSHTAINAGSATRFAVPQPFTITLKNRFIQTF